MLPIWIWSLPLDVIDFAATKHNVDRDILAAIVQTESGGEPCRTRFEPAFNYLNNPAGFAASLGISHETEIQAQKTSWGPCQVMGATARDLGFSGLLPELCRPEVGCDLGARYLASKFRRYDSMAEAVAAYNAGTARKTKGGLFENQRYVDKVMSYYREITGVE